MAAFTDWGPGQPNGRAVQNCACLRRFNGYRLDFTLTIFCQSSRYLEKTISNTCQTLIVRWDDCGCTTYSWPSICKRLTGMPIIRLFFCHLLVVWNKCYVTAVCLYKATIVLSPLHFRLRGLCAYSDIDTIYTPKNYGKDGELMFVGYDHNQIIYDSATSQWEITKLSVTGNFTRAVTKASLASMAIGTNVWTVFNDSKR